MEIICICCPKGCHINVTEGKATGAGCPRGAQYALRECTCPTRVVTSTVRVAGALYPRLPVKTDRDIPKGLIFPALRLLDGLTVQAPVAPGQAVTGLIPGTDARWIATRAL